MKVKSESKAGLLFMESLLLSEKKSEKVLIHLNNKTITSKALAKTLIEFMKGSEYS